MKHIKKNFLGLILMLGSVFLTACATRPPAKDVEFGFFSRVFGKATPSPARQPSLPGPEVTRNSDQYSKETKEKLKKLQKMLYDDEISEQEYLDMVEDTKKQDTDNEKR